MATTFHGVSGPRVLQMIERQKGKLTKTHLQSAHIAGVHLSHHPKQDSNLLEHPDLGSLQQCQCDTRKWDRRLAGDEVGGTERGRTLRGQDGSQSHNITGRKGI